MSLITEINSSKDIKKLNVKELKTLAREIRSEIISVTEKNGGHLSSNLGIVELTLALHYVFDFPKDKIVFDVGHQCYTHKILSGRREAFSSIRTDGGISGFPDSEESEYDAFSTGHAGTSLSAGLGLCTARDRLKDDYCVINVVGDGSLVNGLNLEAMFATQDKPKKYIVILNDNGMSISKNKNGFYRFISKSTARRSYVKSKKAIKKVFRNSFITRWLVSFRDFIKRVFNKRNYFEQFGFKYIEVADGNDIKKVVKILNDVKGTALDKAVFLHLHTTKGKGLREAEERSDVYHGVGKSGGGEENNFSSFLGDKINSLIENDEKIIAITAGMKDGTGLNKVEEAHPHNFFDVGIAEEYAVTFAAGMAKGGLKPLVAIYSTFLQRAYDQILHDVCIQNLPVIFLLDRAGLNGEDGKTHQGVFDLSYLSHMPNMTVLAPGNLNELSSAIDYAIKLNSPVAIRYPKKQRENSFSLEEDNFGKWVALKEGSDVTLLAVGPDAINVSLECAKEYDGKVRVVNARTVKPLDVNFLEGITSKVVITLEENAVIGGFGQAVSAYYTNSPIKVFNLGVRDEFITHGTRANQLKYNGLNVQSVKELIEKSL